MGLLGYLEAWKEMGTPLEIVVYASRQEVIDAATEVRADARIVPFALGQRPSVHFLMQQTRLGRLIARTGADLVWSPQYGIHACPVPQVVYHTNLLRFSHPTLVSRLQERSCSPLSESVLDIAARSALRKAARNVFISDYMRRTAESIVPESKERNVVIHNGLSFSWCGDLKSSRADWGGRPHLAAIQHSETHKDNPTLIRTLAELVRIRPSVRWKLKIAGGGDWSDIRQLAHALGVGSHIEYLGHLSHADIGQLLDQSLCFLFTSVLEGFGNPPLEAMARRCPVLACDITAIPEVVGDAGILVPPGDFKQFAQGVVSIYEDRAFRRSLIEKGVDRIERFRWTDSARKMYDLFESIAISQNKLK